MADELIFYYSPQSRSTGVRVLLEELGVPFTPEWINIRTGDNLAPAFRAINPMGKVPAIRHNGAVVTEQVAIYLYLADSFPKAGLAPPIGDPLRGSYLRWMVFYGSCVEPAGVDKALKREPGMRAMSPYGDFDTVVSAVTDQLRSGPWMLGDRYTAVDTLYGTALSWLTQFGIFPKGPEVAAFLDRFAARPAFRTVSAQEAAEVAALAGKS